MEAWTHGPVIPDLYHEYKCHGSNLIPSSGIPNETSLSKEEALQRIKSQIPVREKEKLGDYVVDNSFTQENTYNQVDRILEKLKLGE